MKKMLFAAFVLTLVMPVFASDEGKAQENIELCKTYAKEDGVAADELEEFLANCVKDLEESDSGDKG